MKSGALVSPPNLYPPCWKVWLKKETGNAQPGACVDVLPRCYRKRGKSARASPTPHHTLNEEQSARFTAQHLSALVQPLLAEYVADIYTYVHIQSLIFHNLSQSTFAYLILFHQVRTRQSQVLLSRISIHLPAVARVRTRAHHFWMDIWFGVSILGGKLQQTRSMPNIHYVEYSQENNHLWICNER